MSFNQKTLWVTLKPVLGFCLLVSSILASGCGSSSSGTPGGTTGGTTGSSTSSTTTAGTTGTTTSGTTGNTTSSSTSGSTTSSTTGTTSSTTGTTGATLAVGSPPPAFSAPDLNGVTASPSEYLGRVVLIDFWRSTCPFCQAEVPTWVAVYNKYHAQGFDILGVDIETNKQQEINYMQQNGMTWRSVFDGLGFSSPLITLYNVPGTPFGILVGRDGKVIAIGDSLRGVNLDPAVKAAL